MKDTNEKTRRIGFDWTLSHTPSLDRAAADPIPATVPGAVQLDYARAKNYKPYTFGLNFKQFDWMEDEYFIYSAPLDFSVGKGERAHLVFEGIDYKYLIRVGGTVLTHGEGMFTPVRLDVTRFAGKATKVEVVIFPIPKIPGRPQDRTQAAASCKPASAYGWDWHPRLVPSGIWKEAYLQIIPDGGTVSVDLSYRLSDDLSKVTVDFEVCTVGSGRYNAVILSLDGEIVAERQFAGKDSETVSFSVTLENPALWYPVGYGEHPVYTVEIRGAGETLRRKIGFRRVRLLRNAKDEERFERGFPKTCLPAPATIEINGVRVFAKGTNFVNPEIFPCLATDERCRELVGSAARANFNILRMWGGQYFNRDALYDACDEAGLMVWQEFMLSCNIHPDTDAYLAVLEREATTIIKWLRVHPSLTLWCGGNELFNSWSGMTPQAHPLRLLDSLCYKYDRFTPFNMTSPLYGMAHGSYVKVIITEGDGDEDHGEVKSEEFLSVIKRSQATTYTEFGCNGGATPEYLKKYVMTEEDYRDCHPSNEVWTSHHAFGAWNAPNWLGKGEVRYYFGAWRDMDDLMDKTLYLQAMAYQTMFEEMRRQWPACSMAINWDFNEPWPCAAGNSLLNWPSEPKPAYFAVQSALRPTILSADASKNRFLSGEDYTADVWVLNDAAEPSAPVTVTVTLICGETRTEIGKVEVGSVAPRSNAKFGSVSFPITKEMPERFSVEYASAERPEYNSTYHYVRK